MNEHLDQIKQQAEAEGWTELSLHDGVWWGYPDEFAIIPQPYPGDRKSVESMPEALAEVAKAMEEWAIAAERVQQSWKIIKNEEAAIWKLMTQAELKRRNNWWSGWWRIVKRLGRHK